MSNVNLRYLIASLLVVFAVGCGETTKEVETADVEGTVTMDKKPLTNATIAFQDPQSGATDAAELDASGSFKLKLPIGKYEVSFTPPTSTRPPDETSGKMEADNVDIPIAYQTGDTSGEKAEVKSGVVNTFKFELSKSGPANAPAAP